MSIFFCVCECFSNEKTGSHSIRNEGWLYVDCFLLLLKKFRKHHPEFLRANPGGNTTREICLPMRVAVSKNILFLLPPRSSVGSLIFDLSRPFSSSRVSTACTALILRLRSARFSSSSITATP